MKHSRDGRDVLSIDYYSITYSLLMTNEHGLEFIEFKSFVISILICTYKRQNIHKKKSKNLKVIYLCALNISF